MKLRNIFTAVLALPALLLASCCDEDSNWNPGPKTENIHQVYFKKTLSEAEAEPNTPAEFTVQFYRKDSQGAISVPLTVEGSEIFEVPATVDFADGESSVEVTIAIAPTEVTGLHECTIKIPDGIYSSPYSKEYTTHILRLTVIKWVPYAENAQVYGSDDNKKGGAIDPNMPAYTTTLYKAEGMDRYYVTIGNRKVVFNTVTGDTLDEGVYYIYPMGGYTGIDPYDNVLVWYFASNPNSSYVIQWPGTESTLDFCEVYLGTGSYDLTVLNPEEKYLRLSIIAYQYDASNNPVGYVYKYIYVDWNSEN